MGQHAVLLFVPAVKPTENQTALRIAQLIAQAASKSRRGTYAAASSATSKRATVRDPDGNDVLTLIQVPYHDVLYGQKKPTRNNLRQAFRALAFASFATWRVLWTVRRCRSKSPNAKWQVLLAWFFVLILWLGFFLLVLLVLQLLGVDLPDWAPDWLTEPVEERAALTGGVTGLLAIAYWRIRDPIVDHGRRLQALMGYVERTDDLLRLTSVVDQAIDDALEEFPDGTPIHLFGFSFGSIVLLDAVFPSAQRRVERRELGQVASLTTVGCPADFVRLLYPQHFEHRESRLPEGTPWQNLYVPADVLGSNFAVGGDGVVGERPRLPIADRRPDPNYAADANRRLGIRALALEGFKVHGRYWDQDEPRHLEQLLGVWLPETTGTVAADA